MAKKPIIYLRSMDCPPEIEDKVNKWYNEVHIPMIFKYKGMKKAARYKRIGNDENSPKYIAIFEFDSFEEFEKYNKSPERTAALKDREATFPLGSAAPVAKWQVQYELIKSWKR